MVLFLTKRFLHESAHREPSWPENRSIRLRIALRIYLVLLKTPKMTSQGCCNHGRFDVVGSDPISGSVRTVRFANPVRFGRFGSQIRFGTVRFIRFGLPDRFNAKTVHSGSVQTVPVRFVTFLHDGRDCNGTNGSFRVVFGGGFAPGGRV